MIKICPICKTSIEYPNIISIEEISETCEDCKNENLYKMRYS